LKAPFFISPQKKRWRRMIGARSNPENNIYYGAHASNVKVGQ